MAKPDFKKHAYTKALADVAGNLLRTRSGYSVEALENGKFHIAGFNATVKYDADGTCRLGKEFDLQVLELVKTDEFNQDTALTDSFIDSNGQEVRLLSFNATCTGGPFVGEVAGSLVVWKADGTATKLQSAGYDSFTGSMDQYKIYVVKK